MTTPVRPVATRVVERRVCPSCGWAGERPPRSSSPHPTKETKP